MSKLVFFSGQPQLQFALSVLDLHLSLLQLSELALDSAFFALQLQFLELDVEGSVPGVLGRAVLLDHLDGIFEALDFHGEAFLLLLLLPRHHLLGPFEFFLMEASASLAFLLQQFAGLFHEGGPEGPILVDLLLKALLQMSYLLLVALLQHF